MHCRAYSEHVGEYRHIFGRTDAVERYICINPIVIHFGSENNILNIRIKIDYGCMDLVKQAVSPFDSASRFASSEKDRLFLIKNLQLFELPAILRFSVGCELQIRDRTALASVFPDGFGMLLEGVA